MKVLLLFPPCWHPIMPHMAVPSLTAYLRQQGVRVIQQDLNIQVYDAVLSKRHLDGILRQLERERKSKTTEALTWAGAEGVALAARVEEAKSIVRGGRFFEAATGLDAFLTLNQALDLASVPYLPSRLHFLGYDSAYPVDASQAILAAVRDRKHNLFHDLFLRSVLPWIVRERPDIVGISMTSARQVIAGFTLAHLIKESGVRTHITLGGKMITCWRNELPKTPQLFSLFDSAVIFAGEQPLLRLIEAVDRRKSLSSTPNLIYREGNRVAMTDVQPPIPLADLPPPDYDGFPLGRYLAPEVVLPVSASRGCYWHRCAFCNVGHGESKAYEEKAADCVHQEMVMLASKHGSNRFFFSDEAVSPRIFKLLSRRILESGDNLAWACAARFERSFDAPTLQRMARAGCKMLMFGLESGSARILQRMDKGTSLDVARCVLRDSAEAGIWNHIFFFFGFPGETFEEAQETIDFLFDNREYVHSVCSGTFMLEKHSRVWADPQSYDVVRLIQRRERDLAYYYDYTASSGISAEEAERVEELLLDALPKKELAHIYFHDIYRFLYACRFGEGEPYPTMM